MKFLMSAVLYIALTVGANAADLETLNGLRDGDMKKLNFHSDAKDVSQAVFTAPDGTEYTLADWQGKIVLLNFWATWCAPCRHEMPALDALQGELGGDAFEVVTLATGRNAVPGIERFFEEVNIQHLPILLDPKQAVAREMAVLGLPITVILNREGQEIARLRGDAEWNSDSAKAILRALIAG
ncbi:TlpA family protein disulfide reductase [Oceaniglobus ichthyenteri]|uniref:TlpA family protein disulfide reductase n=1 Tax=Oceaniglobus ichthyenteri TaxID=2136177 RepID=UPI000D3B33D4|nr:TlpA disulfide reductase family protein [Oceaniglobus ichthyenteri]